MDVIENLEILRFFRGMIVFLEENVEFFIKVFDKFDKEKIQEFYKTLFGIIISQYAEKLTNEFT